MKSHAIHDITDLVTAARTNDPRVVSALSERFSSARFHLPLTSLEWVKNRPETALGLGASLPLHQLRLDTGLIAIPVFTTLELCRNCARKLSWKTDGKVVKTLPVPGSIALPYLKELLLAPEIDRLIVNPLSDGALHLARTEVEAIAGGQVLRTLWLYDRNGGLNRPVEIEGGSLLGSLLSAAGLSVSKTGVLEVSEEPSFETLPDDPHARLAAELYRLLYPEVGDGLEIIVTRVRDGVRIESTPSIDARRLGQAQPIAEKHMAHSSVGTRTVLRMDRSSVVVSSSAAVPEVGRKEPAHEYIPLEPEAPESRKKGS